MVSTNIAVHPKCRCKSADEFAILANFGKAKGFEAAAVMDKVHALISQRSCHVLTSVKRQKVYCDIAMLVLWNQSRRSRV